MKEVINFTEFGIEESKAKTIESSFVPKITEFESLSKVYKTVIESEVTKENCKNAGDLRRQLVKVRTGIAAIHKTEKTYYLAAGRYVDALKNKLTEPVEQMESKLEEIETHFERIEAQKIEALKAERLSILSKYTDSIPVGLGTMDGETFDNLLQGAKFKYEAIKEAEIKAENERIENERLDKLEYERRLEFAPYVQFLSHAPELRLMSNDDYVNILNSCKAAKLEHEKEQKRIKEENERLEKEQAELKAKAEKERLESERILNDEIKASQQRLEKEQAEARRLAAELQAKKESEQKAEAEKLAKIEAEKKEAEKLAKAPIKKQMAIWVDTFKLPDSNFDNDIAKEIISKFEAFKSWSKKEIEKL